MDEIEAITTDLDSLLVESSHTRRNMTKRLIVIGTAVMTTLLALVLLWQFRVVVIYVIISLTLAAALRPLVKRWSNRGFAASSLDVALPGGPGWFWLPSLSHR